MAHARLVQPIHNVPRTNIVQLRARVLRPGPVPLFLNVPRLEMDLHAALEDVSQYLFHHPLQLSHLRVAAAGGSAEAQ